MFLLISFPHKGTGSRSRGRVAFPIPLGVLKRKMAFAQEVYSKINGVFGMEL